MTSAPARKQTRKRQTRTAGSLANSHEAISDEEARFLRLPVDVQNAIGCRNMAKIIRNHAKRDGLSIEEYVTGVLPTLNGNHECISLLLTAVGLLAAEDERRGGGPLRVAEMTFEAYAAAVRS